MGSFFTNVQAAVVGGDAAATRATVIAAVRAAATAAGMIELHGDDAAGAERTVAIAGDDRWIAIYDEATESQDSALLEALTAAISRATGGAAVSVVLHDSDVVQLELYLAGERRDTFCNAPAYFERVSKQAKAAVAGQPERWRDLLAGGDVAALAKLWSRRDAGAEESLDDVGALVGWSPQWAGTGFKYLMEHPPADLVRLGFRDPAVLAAAAPASGLPVFRRGAYNPVLDLSVGEPLAVHFSMRCDGGAGRGVTVVISGPAVVDGFLEVTEVRAWVGRPGAPVTEPLVRGDSSIGPRWLACFDDFELPAGLADRDAARHGGRVVMEAWRAAEINFEVAGTVKRAGQAKLSLTGAPQQNWAEGQAGMGMKLNITATPRRPLRAPATATAHMLRPLDEPRTLFAVVTLDAPRDRVAAVAAVAMERWHAAVAPVGQYHLVDAQPESKWTRRKLAASKVPAGAAWKRAKIALATTTGFEATCPDVARSPKGYKAFEGRGVGHGMSLGHARSVLPGAEPLPVLGLWIDAAGLDEARLAALTAALVQIVDTAMLDGDGVQAMVGRWAWEPGFSARNTAYEYACGLYGNHHAGQRAWTERWLRGVTGDAMWLGPRLRTHLPDLAPLRALAELTEVGAALRILIRAPADLDAVESALAPLLPSPADRTLT